jgi:predicted AAA+ superfamily ATPase
MPESLARFVDEKTTASGIKQSRAVQNRILLAYRDDFGKYAKRIPVDALRAIVDAMPAIVGASKVKFSAISREYKAEQLRSAMTALEQAGLLHRVFHSPANAIPLAAGEDSAYFKLLPLDIGLWVSQTFGNMIAPEFSDNFFQKWLSENPFEKRWVGQIAEIVVGNSILSQHQIPGRVHYWIREAKSSNAEVDYIVQHGLHVIPVEIKAGNSGSLKSLHLFMQEKGVSHAVRFDTNTPSLQLVQCRASTAGGNVADVSYTLHNLPLYVADWLFEYVAHRLPSN